jgi:hypothetical protein
MCMPCSWLRLLLRMHPESRGCHHGKHDCHERKCCGDSFVACWHGWRLGDGLDLRAQSDRHLADGQFKEDSASQHSDTSHGN